MSDRWKSGIRYFFTAIGLFLFFHLIWTTGWSSLLSNLKLLSWGFIPVSLFGLLWFVCISMAWRELLAESDSVPPLSRLLRLKLMAEAVNVVAPTANLGGEGLRVLYTKTAVGMEVATGSVVLDKTMDNVAKMLFMMVGVLLTFVFMNIPEDWLVASIAFLLIILVFNSAVIALQLSGVFKSLARLFRRVSFLTAVVDKHEEKFKNLDGHLRSRYEQGRGVLFRSMCWHLARRVLNVGEVLFILWMLTSDVSPVNAVFIMTMTTIVNNTFFLIPGQWGVAEGAQLVLTEFAGYSAAVGISLGVIRRLRLLVFTGVGLLLLQKTS